jgi:hypothetical protein
MICINDYKNLKIGDQIIIIPEIINLIGSYSDVYTLWKLERRICIL